MDVSERARARVRARVSTCLSFCRWLGKRVSGWCVCLWGGGGGGGVKVPETAAEASLFTRDRAILQGKIRPCTAFCWAWALRGTLQGTSGFTRHFTGRERVYTAFYRARAGLHGSLQGTSGFTRANRQTPAAGPGGDDGKARKLQNATFRVTKTGGE